MEHAPVRVIHRGRLAEIISTPYVDGRLMSSQSRSNGRDDPIGDVVCTTEYVCAAAKIVPLLSATATQNLLVMPPPRGSPEGSVLHEGPSPRTHS